MDVPRKEILKKLKSIEEPRLIHEGSFPVDQTLRVFTGEGGYLFQTDEHPISGPFSISDDESEEARRVVEKNEDAEEYWDPSQEHIEMVDAGCASDVEYYCYRMNVRSESPIYSENLDELKQMLIEDIMDNIDCEPWDEMSESDLNEWDIWFGYVND